MKWTTFCCFICIALCNCKKDPVIPPVVPDGKKHTAVMEGMRKWKTGNQYHCFACTPVVETNSTPHSETFEMVVMNDSMIYKSNNVFNNAPIHSDIMRYIREDMVTKAIYFENNGIGVVAKLTYYYETNKITYSSTWGSTWDKLTVTSWSE